MPRRAVVLMNLGGPDSPEAIRPFLYNLFSDRAIIDLPAPLRLPLARLIAARRERVAREIYAALGGLSPLLANTEAQATALETVLGPGYRCFIAMRYWHPTTEETVATVRAWQPDEIVLLPLYPQFSTTTTASSLRAWRDCANVVGFDCCTHVIKAYPDEPGFIAALAGSIAALLERAGEGGERVRLLFSAHGLPLKTVARGDPYPQQIERTAQSIAETLDRDTLDWRVCYQSRVGPLRWLRPSLEEELRRAADERKAVVVVPVSFVSEHSETLIELDRDYRRLAEACGVLGYWRAPTVGTDPRFIAALARLVRSASGESS